MPPTKSMPVRLQFFDELGLLHWPHFGINILRCDADLISNSSSSPGIVPGNKEDFQSLLTKLFNSIWRTV